MYWFIYRALVNNGLYCVAIGRVVSLLKTLVSSKGSLTWPFFENIYFRIVLSENKLFPDFYTH